MSAKPGPATTLVRLLRDRAAAEPDCEAFRWVADTEEDERRLTYAALDQKARAVAGWLQKAVRRGDRAVLLCDPGLDFLVGFFGCLYAGVIAVPATGWRARRDRERIESIVGDSEPAAALTSGARHRQSVEFAKALGMRAISIQAIPGDLAIDWKESGERPEELAYLQYTSGSTRAPRGVMISHSNVLSNLEYIAREGDLSRDSIAVSWLPHFHDMGLVYGLLLPLYCGFQVVLSSYATFVQSPVTWLSAITRYRATHSGGPNTAYEHCLNRISPEQREPLDLSSWRVAFNGAETVRAATMERFSRTFEPNGFRRSAFYPVYGLAESTLKVTSPTAGAGYRVTRLVRDQWLTGQAQAAADGEREVTIAGCGHALDEHVVHIVDAHNRRLCKDGQVGEIWVKGPSVALGYWNKSEETEETFRASLDSSDGPYLRTGDLGFMDNGEVFVAGRLKDCIVIRGQNYYPSDIEETVRNSHAALRSAVVAAFAIDIDDHESFVVVAEGPRGADASEFVEPIVRAIGSEHQLKPARVVIVSHSAIPRTSSGKVRRAECRQALAGGSLQTLADRYTEIRNFDEFEMESPAKIPGNLISQIAECAAQLLGCKSEAITAQQDLRELGLDSMRAAELSSALYASVGIGVGILDLLECDSVQEIAALLLNRAGDNAPMAGSTETEFPMSGSQAGLWFLSSLTPESSAYQIARAVRIKGTVDPAALDQSFIELLRRHPALRTSFHETDVDVMQRVAEEVPSSIVEVIDATEWSLTKLSERLNAAANSPFDLTRPPLFRVRLFVEQASATLLIVAHHLICDLWSLDLLLEELSSLSSRESLPVLTHSFADFVRAERAVLMQAEDSWKYWRETLAGELPVLKMAQAHKAYSAIRPAGQLSFSIDWSETEKLKQLASTQGGTLHSVLLAVFQLLLHRHSGQEEVIVGTPTFGRHRAELARTVGCFVNTLPVRTRFDGTSSFLGLHARVRDSVRQTVRHSAVPFAKLVEHLSLTRERGTTPAFQAMFAFQKKRASADEGVSWMAVGAGGGQIRIAELEAETLPLTQGMTQFDLTMTLAETSEGLIGTLAYDSNLFGAPSMAAFVGHFKNLVCEITNRPDRPVGEYDIMPRAERVMQLTSLNDTTRNYGGSDSLHRLLEQQVNLTPDAEALIFGGRRVTYRELDERANAVASVLRDQGEGRGGIVAVCLDRSLELIYTLLGILKVGAAYLPLDPDGPVHRWKDMMAQAGAGVVIGSPDTEPMLSETGVRLVLAEDAASQTSAMNEGATCSADDLAYVIFTSGSTGRPKGVATTHRGITNRLKWMQEKFKLETSDVVLQKTPATFDVSVWEFFWPLMCGARLAIARPGGHRDAAYLAEVIRRHNVTTIHFVPSMLGLFLDEPAAAADCASLRRIICSGETLNPELERKCLETLAGSLHNLYGPTEASVDATAWDCDGQSLRSVPIGFPIANMRAYVLDFEDRIISPAQTGLLHLSGVGLARGYINNPSLTSDRFVPDPYAGEPGARMYRTGDLARYRDDGAIEFVGRSDQQVKIRGFRVELQEIEHVLAKHPSIKECAVDLQTFSDDVHLVAFFVPVDSLEPDTTALRAHLRESLPHYMVPASFVALETMPLNQNGKLDRKGLPKIDRFRFCANQYVKPRTTIERAVTEIWSELLEIPGIGADDNFFELGGHSILASRMMNRIRDTFQIDIPLLAFFEGEPTIASLAERVQAALVGEGSHTERDQNLEPYTGEPLIVVT